MRVIVAHSNSFIPSKCKKQRPYQKAKCRSRNVRRQSVVARLRALQGVCAFLTVSTETAERSSRKNAGTSLIRRSSRLSAKPLSISFILLKIKNKPEKPSSGLCCMGNSSGDGVARRSGLRSRPCHQGFVRHQGLYAHGHVEWFRQHKKV